MKSLNIPLTGKPFIALDSSLISKFLEFPQIFSCQVFYRGSKSTKTRHFRIYDSFLLISQVIFFSDNLFISIVFIRIRTSREAKQRFFLLILR